MSFHIAISQNTIRRRKVLPRASYLVCDVIIIRAGALEKSAKKVFSIKSHNAQNESFSPFPIFIQCRTHSTRAQNRRSVGSQSKSSTKNPHTSSANQNRARNNHSTSSANQNRVLRHPSRQPIRIEYYVTRELSARLEDPFRLSASLGSL